MVVSNSTLSAVSPLAITGRVNETSSAVRCSCGVAVACDRRVRAAESGAWWALRHLVDGSYALNGIEFGGNWRNRAGR